MKKKSQCFSNTTSKKLKLRYNFVEKKLRCKLSAKIFGGSNKMKEILVFRTFFSKKYFCYISLYSIEQCGPKSFEAPIYTRPKKRHLPLDCGQQCGPKSFEALYTHQAKIYRTTAVKFKSRSHGL